MTKYEEGSYHSVIVFSCVTIKIAQKLEKDYCNFQLGQYSSKKKKMEWHLTCAAESLLFRNEVGIPTQMFSHRLPFTQTVTIRVIKKRKKIKSRWMAESVSPLLFLYMNMFSLCLPSTRLFPRRHVFHMSRALRVRMYICGAKVNTPTLSQPAKPTPYLPHPARMARNTQSKLEWH